MLMQLKHSTLKRYIQIIFLWLAVGAARETSKISQDKI